MPNVDVVTEATVARRVEEVAAYAAEPDNAPEWYENIESVRWLTPRPLQVGTRVAFVAAFLGRRLSYTYEVRTHEPGRRLVMSTAEGPFPMETTYEWEALEPDATLMRLRNRGAPSGFAGIAAPLLALAMRRANRKDLRALARVLEARPHPS